MRLSVWDYVVSFNLMKRTWNRYNLDRSTLCLFVQDVGSKLSPYSSHLDAAPEYPRALSLLSNNSWGPESMALNPIQENEARATMHGIPEGTPLSSSSFWLHPPSAHQPWPADANFQLFGTPCEETDLYSNIMNWLPFNNIVLTCFVAFWICCTMILYVYEISRFVDNVVWIFVC